VRERPVYQPPIIMFAQERLKAISKVVRERRRMTFAELQAVIPASPATIRRDLGKLEQSDQLIRVHGGVMDTRYVRSAITVDERMLRNVPAKRAIAALAARLIPAGASVLIDAGTTCLEAGKALFGRNDVRIITHSVTLVEAARQSEAELLCVGGELRKVSGALTGGEALGILAAVRADFAFIGASGLDAEEGCSSTQPFEAEMTKAIISRAKRKILLADSTKWERPSIVRFAEWSELDDWITDTPRTVKEAMKLKAFGLNLHVACGSKRD
jgi:DeoR family transcriptional regulator, fructose operon transcriptional repressor